jgi:hypothetical protein
MLKMKFEHKHEEMKPVHHGPMRSNGKPGQFKEGKTCPPSTVEPVVGGIP